MTGLLSFALYVPFLALAAVANLSDRRPWAKNVTYGSLLIINLAWLGFAGLALLVWLSQKLVEPELALSLGLTVNWSALGLICFLAAALASLPLLPVVRRYLSTWLPIDPQSPVHVTALCFAVYGIAAGLAQMVILSDRTGLATSGLSLSAWDVLLSDLPLLLLAAVGVGLLTRRGALQVVERLGLHRPTWNQLLLAVGLTVVLLAFDIAVNAAWQKWGPASYTALEKASNQLYGGLLTVGGALVVGLSAGIGEELLFRGAVQPRLGLLLASLLFAAGHVQYGLTIATAEVLIIGLVLGLVRMKVNTTACILVHAGYDTASLLLVSLLGR